jgi:branched-chain amino acid transport system ATP-binding protein
MIAARGYRVETGHVTGEGCASARLHDPAGVSAYLGGAAVPAVRRMPLPPAFPLPADTGDLGTALAARASLIRAAYTRAERQAAALPSAFVGRYDPKAGGDPWADITARAEAAQRLPPRAPQAARDLAATAPNLAVRAAARHAAHITTARLSAPVPSAFRPAPAPSPRPLAADDPGAPSLIGHNSAGRQIDSAELAAHAAAIHAAHVADRRKRLTAFVVRPRLHPTKEN